MLKSALGLLVAVFPMIIGRYCNDSIWKHATSTFGGRVSYDNRQACFEDLRFLSVRVQRFRNKYSTEWQ